MAPTGAILFVSLPRGRQYATSDMAFKPIERLNTL